jgi:MoaA/NifB/PqqE/SkfB family radical SAM enzyme
MNNFPSKTWCALPWIHMATRPNGDVRLCCTANASGSSETTDNKEVGLLKSHDGTNFNLKHNTLEEIWNSEFMKSVRLKMLNGEKPTACMKCYTEEQNGITSKRIWEYNVWKERVDLDAIVEQTSETGELPFKVPYFDLRLGNACQLKCIMCSPHDSSSWIKDWKAQKNQYTDAFLAQDQGWDSSFDYSWYKKGNFLEIFKKQAPYIKELYFAGGEPLIIEEHYKILNFMIESGFSNDCILRYNSNGLDFKNNLFDIWEKFKQVKFNFSIDAVENKNDYIRFPSKWNDITKNLKMFDQTSDNVTVNIACAVQILNSLNITELATWKLQQNFKKINKKPYGAGIIGLHLVYLPSYLNIRVLPPNVKEQVAIKINNFCNELSTDSEFINNSYGKSRWQGIIKYMMQEDWTNKLPSLTQYIKITDKQRNLNILEVFPELKEIFCD